MLQKKVYIGYMVALMVFFFAARRLYYDDDMMIVDAAAGYLVYPFLKLQHMIVQPIRSYLHQWHDITHLQQEIKRLRNDKKNLLSSLIVANSLLFRFNKTQEVVQAYRQYHYDQYAYLAQIIYRQCSSQEQYVLIDGGSHQGIEVDMIAIYKNCLIGRVSQIFPYHAKVTLITDKSCNIAGVCLQSKASGIVGGSNSLDHLEYKFVSHLHKVQKDDMIISSGEGLIFPAGFGLGSIISYQVDGLYYHINIKPLVDLSSLEYCYIMRKGA